MARDPEPWRHRPVRRPVPGLRWVRGNTAITALARDHGICRVTGYR
jgi:hypothetical protein